MVADKRKCCHKDVKRLCHEAMKYNNMNTGHTSCGIQKASNLNGNRINSYLKKMGGTYGRSKMKSVDNDKTY